MFSTRMQNINNALERLELLPADAALPLDVNLEELQQADQYAHVLPSVEPAEEPFDTHTTDAPSAEADTQDSDDVINVIARPDDSSEPLPQERIRY